MEEKNEVTLQGDYQTGNWMKTNKEITLNQNQDIVVFPKDKLEIFYQNRLYHLISDKELETELVILLTMAINRYSAQKQLKENQNVNPEGFGQGIVFKNFDNTTKIILS